MSLTFDEAVALLEAKLPAGCAFELAQTAERSIVPDAAVFRSTTLVLSDGLGLHRTFEIAGPDFEPAARAAIDAAACAEVRRREAPAECTIDDLPF